MVVLVSFGDTAHSVTCSASVEESSTCIKAIAPNKAKGELEFLWPLLPVYSMTQ